jgi:hypothetical protein
MKPRGARGARAWPRAFVTATALWSVSCAASLMKLPAGAGVPAADAADVLAQATATCRTVRTLTAEISISGSAGGRRLRGRLSAGIAAPASVRLEAVAPFGPPLFIFAARDNDDATLLLPRDDRMLEHGRADAVLDAVAGVPLDAADLNATLTGCAPALAQQQGHSLGDDWRVVSGPDGPPGPRSASYTFYLHRNRPAEPWRLVVTRREGAADGMWRAEYRDFQNGLPHSIRIAGDGLAGTRFDLNLALSQVETNAPLGADAFRLPAPPSTTPITLEELRRARTGVREN